MFEYKKPSKEAFLAYRSGVGMWAYLLHRVTGLALIFYLLIHICVISTSLKGPETFNVLLAKLTSPPFIALDLLLLAAVLFHSLNGFRVLLFDMGIGIRNQKSILWAIVAIVFVIWIATLYITLPFIFRS